MQQQIVPVVPPVKAQTPDEILKELKQRMLDIKHPLNFALVFKLHAAATALIQEKKAAWYCAEVDKPDSMIREYRSFFDKLFDDSTIINTIDFSNRATDHLKAMSSIALTQALSKTLRDDMTLNKQGYQDRYEEMRKEHVRNRENISAKGLTLTCYWVYLDLITRLIPGAHFSMPWYFIGAAAVGLVGNFATTEYASAAECERSVKNVTERVANDSGLKYCYSALMKLTEKVSHSVADQAMKACGDQPRGDQQKTQTLKS